MAKAAGKRKKCSDTFEGLCAEYEAVMDRSCKPGSEFRKVSVGTVLDEEKSVRWNREEVARLREEYDEEVRRLNREKNGVLTDVQKRVYALISAKTGVPEEKAKRVWDFAVSISPGPAVFTRFQTAEELCDLLTSLLE